MQTLIRVREANKDLIERIVIRKWLLPIVIYGGKICAILVFAGFVSIMTFLQLRMLLVPEESVAKEVHFKFDPGLCSFKTEKRLRECSYLTANFSVINRVTKNSILHTGVRYKIDLVLDVPDYSVNYEVGQNLGMNLSLTCCFLQGRDVFGVPENDQLEQSHSLAPESAHFLEEGGKDSML